LPPTTKDDGLSDYEFNIEKNPSVTTPYWGNQEKCAIYYIAPICLYIIIVLSFSFCTVHPESIHSASLFPHVVMLQPYSKMD